MNPGRTLEEILASHNKWLESGGHEGERANLEGANLSGANHEGANLTRANLRGANLAYANLERADLERACLEGANLTRANLKCATLVRVNFRRANLEGASLVDAHLANATLIGANLAYADLERAYLEGACFVDANLVRVNFEGAKLAHADFQRANLSKTTLDTNAAHPHITDEMIAEAGLELDGEFILGVRTEQSMLCGDTTYEVRDEPYVAPVFSVCTKTGCHPGIYFGSLDDLRGAWRYAPLVRVKARRDETVLADQKWRAKRIWVIGEVSR